MRIESLCSQAYFLCTFPSSTHVQDFRKPEFSEKNDLSFGQFDLSFVQFDLSFVQFDLSFGRIDLSSQ